ncbi:tetratricopeptide repeat protein [Ensifer sp. ENS09]|uniref:tetratricopeptide repeat protein n=1 Tax=Ensifer sp. ENS09 TaxID=2769263 RepID=UPI0017866D02|nr:tetratricopeptide repeat protein [Ensifer sp. ENS09]MBD9650268.1 tetratricopeptide repeat protein [Ensifer sp. ENS09]
MRYRLLLMATLLAAPAVAEDALSAAQLLEARDDPEGAIAVLERRLIAFPGDASAQLRLGQIYESIHSEQAARIYYVTVAGNDSAPKSLQRIALDRLRVIDRSNP